MQCDKNSEKEREKRNMSMHTIMHCDKDIEETKNRKKKKKNVSIDLPKQVIPPHLF